MALVMFDFLTSSGDRENAAHRHRPDQRSWFFARALPTGSVPAMMAGLREHFAYVRAHGTPGGCWEKLPAFDQFTDAVGLGEIEELEQHFR
jgi:hypothetical protein